MRRLAALSLVPFLFLAGCGDSKDSNSQPALATVTGAFGATPVVKLPKTAPSTALESRTVIQGNGPAVRSGQLLVANYVGETWRDGHVFDSSFDRKTPAGFRIGVNQVIKGWDEKLPGVKTGSRIVLSIPPDKGYGSEGQPSAGIKGDDTLLFVVDVLGAYDPNAGATGTPTPATAAGLPTVTPATGKEPTVTIPKGAKPPKNLTIKTLIQGTGPAVRKGQTVVHQYVVVNWTGAKTLDTTWKRQTPVALPVGTGKLLAGWDQALTGVKVGSRVLAVVPPSKGFGAAGKPDIGVKATDTLVFVFDVIGAV